MRPVDTPDVAVIGAGPAGIAAALRVHESGARVLVLDDNPAPGGQIWRGARGNDWLRRFEQLKDVSLINCRVVAAETAPLKLLVESEAGAREIAPQKLIIATGAREFFLPFPGWTLPGVFGVGGLQAMAKSGLPIAGKNVVVAGSGPLLLAVVAFLRKHGAHVKVVAEQASKGNLIRFGLGLIRHPGKLGQAMALQLDLLGTRYLQDCWIEEAAGEGRVRTVKLRRGAKTWIENCDYAAVAYGLCPNTEVAALLGCKMAGGGIGVDERQRTSVANVFAAGECTGIGGVDLSIVEGEIAGFAAAGRLDAAHELFSRRKKAQAFATSLNATFTLREELKTLPRADTFVCRCEDVTFARLRDAGSFRAAKLHTRCGMGPCQGRICGPAADFLFGWHKDSVRPPVFPARLTTLAVWNGRE